MFRFAEDSRLFPDFSVILTTFQHFPYSGNIFFQFLRCAGTSGTFHEKSQICKIKSSVKVMRLTVTVYKVMGFTVTLYKI